MNCSEVGARLGAFADEELPRSIRQEVDAHLADCPVCHREAERLTANLAFMKRTMSLLASGDELNGGFLDELRPKTKAEVAAAEREVSGQPDTHRVRNLVVAVVVLIAAVVAYLTVFAPGDDAESGSAENRATIPPPVVDPRPAGTTRKRDPRSNDRPTVRPAKRNVGGTIDSLPEDITRALRSRAAAARIPRIIKTATRLLATSAEVDKVRKFVVAGREPRMTGILLVVLGSAPDPSTVRPILVTHMRTGNDPIVRAAAAIGLCRTAPRNRQVVQDGFRIPVGTPVVDALQPLILALTAEADPSVIGVQASLLGPVTRMNAKLAVTLVEKLPSVTDAKAVEGILAALAPARHAEMAPGLERWLSTGTVTGMALPRGLTLLGSIDAARAAGIAVNLLQQGTIRDAEVRKGLLGLLAGSRDERVDPILRNLLESDPDAAVRQKIVEMASRLGPARARELLRLAANDRSEPVRKAAQAALKAMAGTNGGGRPGKRNGKQPPRDR
jgi:HEAT repeats/Putative zinc-finger